MKAVWAVVGVIVGVLLGVVICEWHPTATVEHKVQHFALRPPPSPTVRRVYLSTGSLQPPKNFQQVQIPTFDQPQANIESFIQWFAYHDELVWNDYFAASGLPSAQPALRFVPKGQHAHTKCVPSTTGGDTFFCSAEGDAQHKGGIWISDDEAVTRWDTPQAGGPYGVESVIDHEYGHFVQWWLQYHALVNPLPNIPTPQDEFMATCFAGNVGNLWYNENGTYLLDGADASMQGNGDAIHGTGAQEQQAYRLGYQSGSPVDCVNAYWPGIHV